MSVADSAIEHTSTESFTTSGISQMTSSAFLTTAVSGLFSTLYAILFKNMESETPTLLDLMMRNLFYLDDSKFTQCKCDGKKLIDKTKKFPDYASCRKECKETSGCKYFGVWNSSKFPDTCMGWDSCDKCITIPNYNQIYQLKPGRIHTSYRILKHEINRNSIL